LWIYSPCVMYMKQKCNGYVAHSWWCNGDWHNCIVKVHAHDQVLSSPFPTTQIFHLGGDFLKDGHVIWVVHGFGSLHYLVTWFRPLNKKIWLYFFPFFKRHVCLPCLQSYFGPIKIQHSFARFFPRVVFDNMDHHNNGFIIDLWFCFSFFYL
jgi:hypothetical protein